MEIAMQQTNRDRSYRGHFTAGGVFFCALLLVAGSVMGQPTAGVEGGGRLAVIDVQRLIGESAAGTVGMDELRVLTEQKDAELKQMQDEINELRSRLTEGRLSLSDEKIAEMEKEGEDKVIAFQRLQDDAERDLQKARTDTLERIERQVMPVIAQVGEELGYYLIFNKYQSGLLFAHDSADITDSVLERFNASTEDN